MTSIEKATITVGKAAVIIIAIVSFVITVMGVYYAAINGVREGFNRVDKRIDAIESKTNERFKELEVSVDHANNRIVDMDRTINAAISTYLSEGNKPDDVRRRNYNYKRN